MATFPTDLRYSADHEWVDDSVPATVGITDTATEALGDIVYLELPSVGDVIEAGSVIGEVESTKSVSDLLQPGSGADIEVHLPAYVDPSGGHVDAHDTREPLH